MTNGYFLCLRCVQIDTVQGGFDVESKDGLIGRSGVPCISALRDITKGFFLCKNSDILRALLKNRASKFVMIVFIDWLVPERATIKRKYRQSKYSIKSLF